MRRSSSLYTFWFKSYKLPNFVNISFSFLIRDTIFDIKEKQLKD